MNNVHGFGARGYTPQPQANRPILISSFADQDMKYWSFIFPKIHLKSIVSLISAIQVVMFLISAFYYENEFHVMPVNAFSISNDSLKLFGGSSYKEIREEFQIWRLITPIFLHANILHIVINLMFQLRASYSLEYDWGVKTYCIIYFIAGLCGNLLSVVGKRASIAVGASTATCGLIGTFLADIILKWHSNPNKMATLVNLLMGILMTFILFSWFGDKIDHMGHIGGLIAGVLLFLSLNPKGESDLPTWYPIGRKVCIGLLAVFITVTAVGIFTF